MKKKKIIISLVMALSLFLMPTNAFAHNSGRPSAGSGIANAGLKAIWISQHGGHTYVVVPVVGENGSCCDLYACECGQSMILYLD